MKLQTYKRELPFSYALGASNVYELLRAKPTWCRQVWISADYRDENGRLAALCNTHGVPLELNSRAVKLLSPKENCYAVGVFDKTAAALDPAADHIVLVAPADRGNVGTILRTAAAFAFQQVIVIDGVDVYHPKVIRAGMGAFFHVDTVVYDSFGAYQTAAGGRKMYPFLLDGHTDLTAVAPPDAPVSLIFGNEASGLPGEFHEIGTSVKIDQTSAVDSLSLPMAAAIGAFWFRER